MARSALVVVSLYEVAEGYDQGARQEKGYPASFLELLVDGDEKNGHADQETDDVHRYVISPPFSLSRYRR